MPHNDVVTDFELLSTAANYIKNEFIIEFNPWADSPFSWVLKLPAPSKGKLGKLLVFQWCALRNLSVDRSPDSDADMLINGHRIEVKFSTLWKSGIYRFQQIRDQNYEFIVCLGISPFEAHCWIISKLLLSKHVIGHLGQHLGSTGKDTAWLKVKPDNPPIWLRDCGGSLEEAYRVLKNLKRK